MTDSQNPIPLIEDKRPKIMGLLPKNAQARVLAGIAILIILVMMFSGRKSAPTKAAPRVSPPAAVMDPNAARIREYQARIEEQTRELALEEAQLAQTKEALGVRPTSPSVGQPGTPKPSYAMAPTDAEAPQKNWIELDREKREYQGLYASNIALSYRPKAPETLPVKESEPERSEISSVSAVYLANHDARAALSSSECCACTDWTR